MNLIGPRASITCKTHHHRTRILYTFLYVRAGVLIHTAGRLPDTLSRNGSLQSAPPLFVSLLLALSLRLYLVLSSRCTKPTILPPPPSTLSKHFATTQSRWHYGDDDGLVLTQLLTLTTRHIRAGERTLCGYHTKTPTIHTVAVLVCAVLVTFILFALCARVCVFVYHFTSLHTNADTHMSALRLYGIYVHVLACELMRAYVVCKCIPKMHFACQQQQHTYVYVYIYTYIVANAKATVCSAVVLCMRI